MLMPLDGGFGGDAAELGGSEEYGRPLQLPIYFVDNKVLGIVRTASQS